MAIKLKDETPKMMTDLMIADKLSQSDQIAVNTAFKTVLNTKDYITHIKYEVDNIERDDKFNQNDIPEILKIIIETNNLKNSTIQLKTLVTQTNMKYIIYGLLVQFVTFKDQSETELFLNALPVVYPGLWILVSISVNGIKSIKCCC